MFRRTNKSDFAMESWMLLVSLELTSCHFLLETAEKHLTCTHINAFISNDLIFSIVTHTNIKVIYKQKKYACLPQTHSETDFIEVETLLDLIPPPPHISQRQPVFYKLYI